MVRRLDNAIHGINHYPADSVIYPVDSVIHLLNNLGLSSMDDVFSAFDQFTITDDYFAPFTLPS